MERWREGVPNYLTTDMNLYTYTSHAYIHMHTHMNISFYLCIYMCVHVLKPGSEIALDFGGSHLAQVFNLQSSKHTTQSRLALD